jgi:predicted secreted protein
LSLIAMVTGMPGSVSLGATQAADLRQLVITQVMHKARISVHSGEEFTVELRVESDNGLQWYLDGYNRNRLVYCGQVVQVPVDQDPSFFGGQHAVRFKLRARSEGESRVRFLYYRPWEGPALAEKEFEVAIVITP